MINIESKAYEKLISDFIDAKDIKTLVAKLSRDRAFHYYVLKDISRGKHSENYKILKKVSRKRKVSESFIIEQAKSVLSYIAPYDEPNIDNYYEILNVPPDASSDIIRESWIELMKSHHPDKAGQEGLNKAKKINEAYDVLSSPIKRIDYDSKYPPVIPIRVEDRVGIAGYHTFLYIIPFLFVLAASYFYLSSSGILFEKESDKEQFANTIGNPTLPEMNLNSVEYRVDTGKGISTETHTLGNMDPEIGFATKSLKSDHNAESSFQNMVNEDLSVGEDQDESVVKQPEIVRIIDDEEDLVIEDVGMDNRDASALINPNSSVGSKLARPVVAVNEIDVRRDDMFLDVPFPDEESLYTFVSQYVSAYKNRDLQTIRSLFAPYAKENGISIYKVLNNYKNNFSTLDIIRYDVKINRTSIDNYSGVVIGDFSITFFNPVSKLTKSSQGSITWLLKWRGHKWEIEEINYKLYQTNVIDG